MLFVECQIANDTLFSLTWVCFIGRRLPPRPVPPRLPCRPERRQTQGQAGVPLQAVRGRRDAHVQVRRGLSKSFDGSIKVAHYESNLKSLFPSQYSNGGNINLCRIYM